MKHPNQTGFSLIELLIVVVIIGIIAALGVPLFKKAISGSENGAIFAVTKIMLQEQTNHYSQHSRYARLDELNTIFSNGFGTTVGNSINRGKFTFTMSPINPTDLELKDTFSIIATRTIDNVDLPYVISVSPSGEIEQIIP